MKVVLLALAVGLLVGCLGDGAPEDSDPASTRSPYVGEQTRAIKALSEDEVRALLAGEGHGYAKAAELNHYPGPSHVLDLASQLDLTEAQVQQIEEIRAAMRDEAMRLGAMLVDAEADLDALFASGDADAARVDALAREIGEIEAGLRAAHLRAHLDTRALLSHDQVMRYDELRGYAGAEASAHAGHAAHG